MTEPTLGKISVYKYSSTKFCEEIHKANEEYPEENIEKDTFFRYLQHYLNQRAWNVRTMVVEPDYVSESYVNDYKSYYSMSFAQRSIFATRIHFFNQDCYDDFIANGILNECNTRGQNIWETYLGYVTILPLGGTLFGASLLRPYPSDQDEHIFCNSIIKGLRFNVFGRQVNDIESIPFQQQDNVVGACATFSLWVAFHKLSKLFGIKMKSPYEITLSAGHSKTDILRLFPTQGLDYPQISTAIQAVGLMSEAFHGDLTIGEIRRITYAYNKMGIPVLLGYQLKTYNRASKKVESQGNHIVPIVGYEMGNDISETRRFNLLGDSIKSIITHNDQLGAFANEDFLRDEDLSKLKEKHAHTKDLKNGLLYSDKINLIKALIDELDAKKQIAMDEYELYKKGEGYTPSIERKNLADITNNYQLANNYLKTFQLEGDYRVAKPNILIVPIDPIIRVHYESIENSVYYFNEVVEFFPDKVDDDKPYVWEIYLDLAVNYKEIYYLENPSLLPERGRQLRKKILSTSYPRYVWIARMKSLATAKVQMDIIYDASSLPNECCLFQLNFLNKDFGLLFCNVAEDIRNHIQKKGVNNDPDWDFTSKHWNFIEKTKNELI